MIALACKDDAKFVIELLNLAMEDIAFHLSGTKNLDESNQILMNFFCAKNNRLSYENIMVFKYDGRVVGAICSYDGKKSKDLDEPFIRRLKDLKIANNIEIECQADELYIDSIAVHEKFRAKGIAKKLIEASFLKAVNLGLNRVSLLVDTKKPYVKNYYENYGFRSVGEKIISKIKYDYMIKDLK